MTGIDMPPKGISTPAFIIYEDRVLHNLERTVTACGGVGRFMPHLKTHRAPWIVKLLIGHGVTRFKAASTAELEMALAAGARHVTWAYATANESNVADCLAVARRFPDASISALVDSGFGWDLWRRALEDGDRNVGLHVDLDPDFGRTGVPMDERAVELADRIAAEGRMLGWHLYDGHVKGTREERAEIVASLAERVRGLSAAVTTGHSPLETIAGCSYTFDLWPADAAAFVSPGSWTYSSAQHDVELAHLGWQPAAFVLATVMSTRNGTATLDAGCKAISPDKPLNMRFRWDGAIRLMNEEHTVVEADHLVAGMQVLLLPQHACTTAYLYDTAFVYDGTGRWDRRDQLGSSRAYGPF